MNTTSVVANVEDESTAIIVGLCICAASICFMCAIFASSWRDRCVKREQIKRELRILIDHPVVVRTSTTHTVDSEPDDEDNIELHMQHAASALPKQDEANLIPIGSDW